MKLILTLISFLILTSLQAFEIKKYAQEFVAPFESPTLYYFLGGSSVSLGFKYLGKETIVDPIQNELTKDKYYLGAWDKPIDQMGKVVPNLAYIAGFGMYGLLTDRKDSLTLSEKMFKATLYSSILTVTLKNIVHEQRPNKGNYLSFPSGHSTTAFAFASVVGANHAWYFGVPAYLMATVVGFQRINSNSHYIHDVIMGATIGITYGLSISKKISTDSVWFPLLDQDRAGLVWLKTF